MTRRLKLLKSVYRYNLKRLEGADYVKTERVSKVLSDLVKRIGRKNIKEVTEK